MTIAVTSVILAISVGIAVLAGRGHRSGGISEFLVGGRSFPAWLVYFLAVGEVYSIGTLLGFPSGIYAHGASYGIWFLGYILLAYVFGYFLAPLVWRAAHKYDAMTIPDIFGRHFSSRAVELTTCITLLIGLIPWGQYQFIGLQVVLSSLGFSLTSLQAVIIAGVLAFLYIAVSGIRSPAYVSILKDTLMILAVVAVGIAVLLATHGSHASTTAATITPAMSTIHGSAMTFAITTIIFQALVFYLGLGASYILPAKSERAIKGSTVWMPLYMLIYPLLVLASYYGLSQYPNIKNPNTIFMVTVRGLLPDWLIGVVAAGAALSGLLVLAATALGIGGMISRNLIPNVRPNTQRRVATLAVAVFLVLGALLTLFASTLMLTVLNLFYGLIAQVVPAFIAVMFVRRVPARAIVVGMVVGVALSIVLYLRGPDVAGINSGVISTGVNALILIGWRFLAPGPAREPIVRRARAASADPTPVPEVV